MDVVVDGPVAADGARISGRSGRIGEQGAEVEATAFDGGVVVQDLGVQAAAIDGRSLFVRYPRRSGLGGMDKPNAEDLRKGLSRLG